jgi:hypothetical protein
MIIVSVLLAIGATSRTLGLVRRYRFLKFIMGGTQGGKFRRAVVMTIAARDAVRICSDSRAYLRPSSTEAADGLLAILNASLSRSAK